MSQLDAHTWNLIFGRLDTESKYKPFALPGSRPHYTPDRPGQVQHIRLQLDLDLEAETVLGLCQIRLQPIRAGIHTLKLDAVRLSIQSVQVEGEAQAFTYDGETLEIQLSQPTGEEPFTLEIAYRLEKPERGLYFIKPTAHYPDKPVQVWTQGEDEDSRYWFPCFDYPGQLATSELVVTVPDPYRAISNGRLLAVEQLPRGKSRYHWYQDQVHPPYLMTLAVGDFAEIQEQWQGIPVIYWVEKGHEAEAKRSLGKTPAMLEFFSTIFGYPYPYPKYAQVCVADFIFGGMENTSTTLLTDRCLMDERAALDHLWTESLVAHELAHQWFGDLLVIKHWAHAWIKEGMATYAEVLWEEYTTGYEEAAYHRYQDQQAYLNEDSNRYRRPMVTHIYKEAIELYDCHIYQKGGCVYHMIRQQLGDTLFQKAIQTFVRTYAHQTVETVDLLRAIEQATGQNLAPLFDQYVFRGGHPDYKVAYSWDPDSHLAKVTVTQTQDKEYLFDLRIPIAFGFVHESSPAPELKTFTLRIHEAEQSFYFPLETKPSFISFDHGNHTLKTVELTYGIPELKAQLHHAPDSIARLLAAQALAKKGGIEAVRALETALKQEPYWHVRVEICKALGSMPLDQAFAVLRATLQDPSPHVRKAALAALSQQKSLENFQAIRPFLEQGDPSYQVEAAAAGALGTIAGSALEPKPQESEVLALFQTALEQKAGWNEVVRSGVMSGLAQMKHSEKALDLLLQHTQLGTPQPLRLAAIRALGTYGSDQENPRLLQCLADLCRETSFFTQMAVITALSQLNSPKAISLLQSLAPQDGRLERRISEAIQKVQSRLGADKSTQQLREELEQLKKTHQELLSRLSALEAKAGSPSANGSSSPNQDQKA
ncbi:MAG: M1 family aminopeptidase [Thermostichus sp. DG_1_5_bins_95]